MKNKSKRYAVRKRETHVVFECDDDRKEEKIIAEFVLKDDAVAFQLKKQEGDRFNETLPNFVGIGL